MKRLGKKQGKNRVDFSLATWSGKKPWTHMNYYLLSNAMYMFVILFLCEIFNNFARLFLAM